MNKPVYLVAVADRAGTFYQETFDNFPDACEAGVYYQNMYATCAVRLYSIDQADLKYDGLSDDERDAWFEAHHHIDPEA